MITFTCGILILILGYFTYGKFIEKFFGIDETRQTPVMRLADGIDFQPMPVWKMLLIQLLNIAGLGPVFGAIMGAMFGTAAYVWILVGCIFMGAMHDFFGGFISLRGNGASLSTAVGNVFGKYVKAFMIIFVCFLLMVVGVLFTKGPADLFENLGKTVIETAVPADGASGGLRELLFSLNSASVWMALILFYYLLSTLFPIDKLIGRIYPFFAMAFIFMVVGLAGAIFWKGFAGTIVLPELSLDIFKNMHKDPAHNFIFPMLFVTISCGALSGFHATQSPMMARCMVNEKYARPVFYGAMILEGLIAWIWATAAIAYCGGVEGLNNCGVPAAVLVNEICTDWLGVAGAAFAVLGVIICPITSGDTALRAVRLTIADAFMIPQRKIWTRLAISLPIVAIVWLACLGDFNIIWRYLGISNQVIACITLWTATAVLVFMKKPHWVASVPATFMTWVCASYFLLAQPVAGGLGIPCVWAGTLAGAVVAGILFFTVVRFARKKLAAGTIEISL